MQPNSYFGGGTDSANVYSQNTRQPNRRKILLLILAVLFVASILAVLSVALSGGKTSGEKLADKFVNSVIAGDYESTFSLLSTETQNSETKVGWKQKTDPLKGFFSSYENLELSEDDESSESDFTTYSYVAKGTDGLYLLSMVVDKKQQKVTSFDSSPYIDVEGKYK